MACNIADKITNIVTDNATNMAKAFQVTLPGFSCDKNTSLKEDTHESINSEDENDDSSLEPMVFDYTIKDIQKLAPPFVLKPSLRRQQT